MASCTTVTKDPQINCQTQQKYRYMAKELKTKCQKEKERNLC